MAQITYVSTSNRNGAAVVQAVEQIRGGFARLHELNGLRAESIGAGQATMAANFGVQDNSQAQTLSDRWGDLMNVMFNPDDPNYNNFTLLRDFLNATTWAI